MKIGDGSSWDSVFTDHLLATSVDRKTDINMQILNRGNCLKQSVAQENVNLSTILKCK